MRDALDEFVAAADSAELHAQTLDRPSARIDRIIHREAAYRRRGLRGLRVAPVARDLVSRILVQPGDSYALERVAKSRLPVLVRERPRLLEAELGQRISRG